MPAFGASARPTQAAGTPPAASVPSSDRLVDQRPLGRRFDRKPETIDNHGSHARQPLLAIVVNRAERLAGRYGVADLPVHDQPHPIVDAVVDPVAAAAQK